MSDSQGPWTGKASRALLLLVTIAIGARVAYGLLVPLVPVLVAAVALLGLYVYLFARRR